MSTEVHKAVVRRCIEEVVNTGTVDRVADFVSPDCIETDGKARVVSGVAGMAAHVTAVRAVWQGLTSRSNARSPKASGS